MILTGEQRWVCPNCPATARTVGADNRFHPCPGLAGLLAPMVLDGVRCEIRAVVREDYVSGEDVRLDGEGRPVMAVVTTRDDGQDCTVYAPTALLRRC
ncbi:hypothetical protein ACH4F6_37795 [Streptomyces sp. NPDC017936]|uniref:hypothetical protein n=1 Tax=Streptomyces sp. NPDC017936 TaxID=3365016 RepID=UPI00379B837D